MGPTFAVRIENPIAINDRVAFVLEHVKIDLTGRSLVQLLDELLGFLMAIDAHRQDLDPLFFLLRQKTFQLPELFRAVGSPMAPVKNQDDIFLAVKIGERDSLPVRVL